ncbi:hypothetical protein Poli38472_003586 [Pythium oligandrum]|uniref:Uncharacterized protein n=1 Tax=Pythium oligandrum TaxID=41045 RepID=A0A8K1FK99_PYTOL|nr:hypothetical protein Poli38472_003586 [Pythium oligandrum]|eukprot:TMW65821.1 hypothetical protein Poli38472_003586 [Pythium oligandrum]
MRVLVLLLALLYMLGVVSAKGEAKKEVIQTRPVLLIPGFASSQLHAWKKTRCNHAIQKNLYRDVNVGDRLWIDVTRILAQGECWLSCMKLHMVNQSEVACKLRAAEGLSAISELDPGIVTGPLSTIWRGLIQDLVDQFHLGPDEIVVAPYDWRLPPARLQSRDKFFLKLKAQIEHTVIMHQQRHPDQPAAGLVVIAHSMGNNVFRYFLSWLRHEVGRHHWQEWIDRHISTYFAVGAPLLGSSEGLELITSGLTQGLPLAQSEVRKLVVTFGSIVGFLPIPSTPRTSHDSDILLSVRFQTNDGETERHYTSVDIASGVFFRDMAVHDPIFADMEEVRKRFYVEDDVIDAFKPWDRPPIENVYAVYGVNMPTKYNYQYQGSDVAGHWYQVSLERESGHRKVCNKTGDATVPYHSLSWAHTWLGSAGKAVNITRTPQKVYYSRDSIQRFKATRQGAEHHADYVHGTKHHLCSTKASAVTSAIAASATASAQTTASPTTSSSFWNGLFGGEAGGKHVTFFERQETVSEDVVRSTGIWEIDGARHREILSHPMFLRELRTELRHLFRGQRAGVDKSARPPQIDGDCYWNYRRAKCEFPEFCEYRYEFGDVTLDQSCRKRAVPLASPAGDKSHAVSIRKPKPDEDGGLCSTNHTPVTCALCDRPDEATTTRAIVATDFCEALCAYPARPSRAAMWPMSCRKERQ